MDALFAKPMLKILDAHPDLWQKVKRDDLLSASFYYVYRKGSKNEPIAFFGVCCWRGYEAVICYLWVAESWRRHGIFNSIVSFVKDRYACYEQISIGASNTNALARAIYGRKFEWWKKDADGDGDWFYVKKPREAK
ncbi:MAG: hypothetical protein LKG11_00825 [Bacilli bacterium]|nr:hypothetical protein [Bacilli bacterium]